MPPRMFSLEDALRLLPLVRQLVGEIQAAKSEVDEDSSELDRLLGVSGGNGHLTASVEAARQKLQVSAERLQRLIAELEELGVELKGIEEGLVDFRSLREGRIVYLCWRQGEESIAWWHELDTGFPGRQPL